MDDDKRSEIDRQLDDQRLMGCFAWLAFVAICFVVVMFLGWYDNNSMGYRDFFDGLARAMESVGMDARSAGTAAGMTVIGGIVALFWALIFLISKQARNEAIAWWRCQLSPEGAKEREYESEKFWSYFLMVGRIVVLVCLFLGAIYLLVQFVKWSWYR
jgi:hypothetical protein